MLPSSDVANTGIDTTTAPEHPWKVLLAKKIQVALDTEPFDISDFAASLKSLKQEEVFLPTGLLDAGHNFYDTLGKAGDITLTSDISIRKTIYIILNELLPIIAAQIRQFIYDNNLELDWEFIAKTEKIKQNLLETILISIPTKAHFGGIMYTTQLRSYILPRLSSLIAKAKNEAELKIIIDDIIKAATTETVQIEETPELLYGKELKTIRAFKETLDKLHNKDQSPSSKEIVTAYQMYLKKILEEIRIFDKNSETVRSNALEWFAQMYPAQQSPKAIDLLKSSLLLVLYKNKIGTKNERLDLLLRKLLDCLGADIKNRHAKTLPNLTASELREIYAFNSDIKIYLHAFKTAFDEIPKFDDPETTKMFRKQFAMLKRVIKEATEQERTSEILLYSDVALSSDYSKESMAAYACSRIFNPTIARSKKKKSVTEKEGEQIAFQFFLAWYNSQPSRFNFLKLACNYKSSDEKTDFFTGFLRVFEDEKIFGSYKKVINSICKRDAVFWALLLAKRLNKMNEFIVALGQSSEDNFLSFFSFESHITQWQRKLDKVNAPSPTLFSPTKKVEIYPLAAEIADTLLYIPTTIIQQLLSLEKLLDDLNSAIITQMEQNFSTNNSGSSFYERFLETYPLKHISNYLELFLVAIVEKFKKFRPLYQQAYLKKDHTLTAIMLSHELDIMENLTLIIRNQQEFEPTIYITKIGLNLFNKMQEAITTLAAKETHKTEMMIDDFEITLINATKAVKIMKDAGIQTKPLEDRMVQLIEDLKPYQPNPSPSCPPQ